MNFNEFIVMGRLTRDPEIRDVNGTNVIVWTIASNRNYTKKNGEKAEKTLFMDCELWGPAAQIIADRAVKGTEMLARGPIEEDNYTSKDGTKRKRYKLRVEFFQCGANSVAPISRETADVAAGGGDEKTDADEPF